MADDKKKLSIAEILAAARKSDAGGGSPSKGEATSKPEAAPEEASAPSQAKAPAAKAPASKPAASKPGGKMSVAEMMAAARAEKAGGAKPAAQEPAAAPAEPKAKESPKAPAKAAEKVAAAELESPGTLGKSSILGGEGDHRKRGPMSKAEAGPGALPPKESPDRVTPKSAAKAGPVLPPMPAKPDYAKKAKQEAAVQPSRRGFVASLGLAVGTFLGAGFTSLAGTLGLWTLGTVRFMFPNVLTEPPSRFKVGYPADFAPGYVENKFRNDFQIWVVNAEYNGKQQIFALSTVCTHLGCTPNWLDAEQKFKCPCHGSGFYKDGINFEGPAPRPLERYAIRLADDGQLEVDKSMKFFEEKGEWLNPDSFVTV